jgi:signal transduction histidine kinase
MGTSLFVLALIVLLCSVLGWSLATASRHEKEITEARKAQERARQREILAKALMKAEERERQRIAQVLHDSVQQTLVGVRLFLGAIQSSGKNAAALARAESLLENAIQDTRTLVVDLSPPVLREAGLVAAFTWLKDHCQERHGLTVHVDADTDAEPTDAGKQDLIFQIVRELLFNVTKHAGSDESWLTLKKRDGMIEVVVRDRGVGCDLSKPAKKHFGLISIQDRIRSMHGAVDFQSAPGKGMKVVLRLPPDVANRVADDALA